MIANIKAAVFYGIILYVIIFIAVSIMLFTPGLKSILWLRWMIDWLVVGLGSYYFSLKYFKKTPGKIYAGAVLAFFWLSVHVVLDLIITVPLTLKSVSAQIGRQASYVDAAGVFYYEWKLWVGFIIMLVVTTIMAGNSQTTTPVQKTN